MRCEHKDQGAPWPAWMEPLTTEVITGNTPYEITGLSRYSDAKDTFWMYVQGSVSFSNNRRIFCRLFRDARLTDVNRTIGCFGMEGKMVAIVLQANDVAMRIEAVGNLDDTTVTLLVPRECCRKGRR